MVVAMVVVVVGTLGVGVASIEVGMACRLAENEVSVLLSSVSSGSEVFPKYECEPIILYNV